MKSWPQQLLMSMALLSFYSAHPLYCNPQAFQNSGLRQIAQNQQSSKSAQELFNQAVPLIEKGRSSEAVTLLRSAIRLAPHHAEYHHYLGYALWKQRDWHQAQAEFEKAHQLDPSDSESSYFLARLASLTGDKQSALSYYQEVLHNGPALYDTNQRLGQIYFERGDLEKARARMQSALMETPWDDALYTQLSLIDEQEHCPGTSGTSGSRPAKGKRQENHQ